MGAVYYISKRIEENDGTRNHTNLYIGQTSDLSTRFDDHHKESCFLNKNANCKSIYAESNDAKRLEIESDLIEALDPPCNG